jgi:hypothetical protein
MSIQVHVPKRFPHQNSVFILYFLYPCLLNSTTLTVLVQVSKIFVMFIPRIVHTSFLLGPHIFFWAPFFFGGGGVFVLMMSGILSLWNVLNWFNGFSQWLNYAVVLDNTDIDSGEVSCRDMNLIHCWFLWTTFINWTHILFVLSVRSRIPTLKLLNGFRLNLEFAC